MPKAVLLLTTALAGYVGLRALTADSNAPVALSETAEADLDDITRRFLMNILMPVWLAAGLADWACHRATSIETTAGVQESLIHHMMLIEAATAVIAGMFLEITSPVLALTMGAALLHEATALWDLKYAVGRREVTYIEQHVHDYLVGVPLAAAAFVSVLHWPQTLALLGIGKHRPDWRIRWKQRPLPWRYISVMLGLQVALEWVPYVEELWRCLRAQPPDAGIHGRLGRLRASLPDPKKSARPMAGAVPLA